MIARSTEMSRRALLALGAGLCSPLAAFSRPLGRMPYVTPRSFGGIANDPGAAWTNVRAFNTMSERALLDGAEMIIPPGTWYLKADGRQGSGWALRPPPARPCVIRGEGESSVIRRAPADSATKFATMIRLWITSGGEAFDLQGFVLDGNEEAFPFDPKDPWAYQQAHCAELACKSDEKAAASLTIRDIMLRGVVADGIKIGAQCARFDAQRVGASGRRRRHRSDIQFSRLPRLATIRDCTVDAFESEPSKMVPGARMEITNLTARSSLDLAGPEDDPDGRLSLEASNCRCGTLRSSGVAVTTTSLYRLEGRFTNCSFATAPSESSHNNMVRGSRLRFQGCKFAVAPASASDRSASPLYAYFERPSDAVEILDSQFRAMPGVAEGAFMIAGGRSPSSMLELRNCETASALDYVVDLAWTAAVRLTGGTLRARKALVGIRPKAKSSTVFFDSPGKWSAPARIAHELPRVKAKR
jgi:hypothetical protein